MGLNPFDSLFIGLFLPLHLQHAFMLQVSKQPQSALWATWHLKMKNKSVATFLIAPTDYFHFVLACAVSG